MHTRRSGELGERIAGSFLEIKGYELIGRNYRFARREVDLLARDGATLVAVEVKLRRGHRFGRAAEAIDRRKIGRLQEALAGLLREERIARTARIDVVAIDINDEQTRMTVEHIVGVY